MDKKISIIVQALVGAARRDLQAVGKELEDLSKRSQQAASATKPLATGFEDLDARAAGLLQRTAALKDELRATREGLEDVGEGFDIVGTMAAGATMGVVAVATAFAAMKLGQKVIELGDATAAAVALREGFDRLAERSYIDSELLLQSLKEASKGTIAEYDLMKEANEAWYLGISQNVKQYSDLMKIAEVKSKDLGMSTLEYWQRLNTALASGYPIGMRQLGIVIDNEKAYRDFAASIGLTASELTDQEQIQARVNATIADGEETLREWETAGTDATTTMQEFHASAADMRAEFVERLLPGIVAVTEQLTTLPTILDQAGYMMGVTLARFRGAFEETARLIEQRDFAAIWAGQTQEAGREAMRAYAQQDAIAKGSLKTVSDYVNMLQREVGRAYSSVADVAAGATRGAERFADAVEKGSDIYDKYVRDVEEANYRFARSVADATFRATQAFEDAGFRRYEIERDAGQRIGDLERDAARDSDSLRRRFDISHEADLAQHLNRLKWALQDHYDELADLEWDYQQDRKDIIKQAPWWIQQTLQKEFDERERIAATGDAKALKDYDKALRERIRAIDPIYAKELDELQEQYDHKAAIEEREARQDRERTQTDWRLRLEEQRANLEEQLRQAERNLQEQTRVAERELRDQLEAWRFHDQQRLENERRAMDNLIADHNRKLQTMYDDTNRRLADLNLIWKHWGYTHGDSYITQLRHVLSTYTPTLPGPQYTPLPPGQVLPPTAPPFPTRLQQGAWDIPSTQLALLHRGEMVVPAGPAERMRKGEGGMTVIIENVNLYGAGFGPAQGRRFARDMAEQLGPMIRQQTR